MASMGKLLFGQIDEESSLGGSICHQLPDSSLDFCFRPRTAKTLDELADTAHVSVGPLA